MCVYILIFDAWLSKVSRETIQYSVGVTENRFSKVGIYRYEQKYLDIFLCPYFTLPCCTETYYNLAQY